MDNQYVFSPKALRILKFGSLNEKIDKAATKDRHHYIQLIREKGMLNNAQLADWIVKEGARDYIDNYTTFEREALNAMIHLYRHLDSHQKASTFNWVITRPSGQETQRMNQAEVIAYSGVLTKEFLSVEEANELFEKHDASQPEINLLIGTKLIHEIHKRTYTKSWWQHKEGYQLMEKAVDGEVYDDIRVYANDITPYTTLGPMAATTQVRPLTDTDQGGFSIINANGNLGTLFLFAMLRYVENHAVHKEELLDQFRSLIAEEKFSKYQPSTLIDISKEYKEFYNPLRSITEPGMYFQDEFATQHLFLGEKNELVFGGMINRKPQGKFSLAEDEIIPATRSLLEGSSITDTATRSYIIEKFTHLHR